MMPQDIDDFTYAIIHMSQVAKKGLCEASGGPADSPPIMLWHGDNEKEVEVVVLPMPSSDGGDESAPALFDAALREGFIQFGKPQYVGFVSEAYMAAKVSEDDARSFKRGELQKQFQENPASDVMEVISIVTFTPDSQMRHVVITVKYDDSGMPEFSKYGEVSQGVQGAIADVVNDFIQFVNAE